MTKIYLIRHAEAEGNLYRRIHGHYNGDITPKGYRQIELLSERFREVPIEAVYASNLQRTQKTAGAILKYHKLELGITPRLQEVDMGVWEDEPWGNIAYDDPEQMIFFANDPAKWGIEGGEPFGHLKSRMTGIISELAEKHDGQTIALFSHGMAIRSFLSEVMGVSSENICQILHGDNTCVACLTYSGGRLDIEYYNDNSHLPSGMSTFADQDWWKKDTKQDFSNLRIIPMDLENDAALYADSYRDSWKSAHGTLKGFSEEPYLRDAERAVKENPLSLMKACSGDEFAGIVELDTVRGSDRGAGWISLLYLVQDYRGHNMGIQLVGHAVSVYRRLGRSSLQLHVSEDNKAALAFYEKFGFKHIGTDPGSIRPLKLMEMKL
ncbi:MAG: bifunctional histidine phosphatase family protein/GNAT family N-acetyltransferase [Oscillospiraceae bacterium]|nr:bifunctional histidine phosphatase family protein/GNAT family N-acetyltransferase [Oscillospiraceae bacterium]